MDGLARACGAPLHRALPPGDELILGRRVLPSLHVRASDGGCGHRLVRAPEELVGALLGDVGLRLERPCCVILPEVVLPRRRRLAAGGAAGPPVGIGQAPGRGMVPAGAGREGGGHPQDASIAAAEGAPGETRGARRFEAAPGCPQIWRHLQQRRRRVQGGLRGARPDAPGGRQAARRLDQLQLHHHVPGELVRALPLLVHRHGQELVEEAMVRNDSHRVGRRPWVRQDRGLQALQECYQVVHERRPATVHARGQHGPRRRRPTSRPPRQAMWSFGRRGRAWGSGGGSAR
mmetsp:Transcript_29332/g.84309  ORF Transcript_29332/g.84309 Transcript_29332/m.84309 type:complete len:290 (-) Transcript_29332:2012-2881(-)